MWYDNRCMSDMCTTNMQQKYWPGAVDPSGRSHISCGGRSLFSQASSLLCIYLQGFFYNCGPQVLSRMCHSWRFTHGVEWEADWDELSQIVKTVNLNTYIFNIFWDKTKTEGSLYVLSTSVARLPPLLPCNLKQLVKKIFSITSRCQLIILWGEQTELCWNWGSGLTR